MAPCHSVWTPSQPLFYGVRLLSESRAFWVDCRVDWRKPCGWGCDQLVDGWEERRLPAMKASWGRPPSFCNDKAVGRIRALAAAKETGRGVPWWPVIPSRVVPITQYCVVFVFPLQLFLCQKFRNFLLRNNAPAYLLTDYDSVIQMSGEWQIGGGVILGASKCQVVSAYTPVAWFFPKKGKWGVSKSTVVQSRWL